MQHGVHCINNSYWQVQQTQHATFWWQRQKTKVYNTIVQHDISMFWCQSLFKPTTTIIPTLLSRLMFSTCTPDKIINSERFCCTSTKDWAWHCVLLQSLAASNRRRLKISLCVTHLSKSLGFCWALLHMRVWVWKRPLFECDKCVLKGEGAEGRGFRISIFHCLPIN